MENKNKHTSEAKENELLDNNLLSFVSKSSISSRIATVTPSGAPHISSTGFINQDDRLYIPSLVDTKKIAGILFSTHKLPLGMTLKYLEKTDADIVFIGVQPKATGFGVEMSAECKNAIAIVKEIVISEI